MCGFLTWSLYQFTSPYLPLVNTGVRGYFRGSVTHRVPP